eukprot:CAMPEP_0113232824 /NCGR_PEP_ID=MMETSP0008_2-20120614/2155_1 /TAXON_ID=97485 /ORGANISM="Prymnesium parvum" /LENGTH=139 /DNA_ID=CAMNT_0000079563 /DNA_START=681 /DNA_END=1100 /DNA_ORIENTATION=- /assembly_acc=CAM_ASM_000153
MHVRQRRRQLMKPTHHHCRLERSASPPLDGERKCATFAVLHPYAELPLLPSRVQVLHDVRVAQGREDAHLMVQLVLLLVAQLVVEGAALAHSCPTAALDRQPHQKDIPKSPPPKLLHVLRLQVLAARYVIGARGLDGLL